MKMRYRFKNETIQKEKAGSPPYGSEIPFHPRNAVAIAKEEWTDEKQASPSNARGYL
jgi:hypothetical protein